MTNDQIAAKATLMARSLKLGNQEDWAEVLIDLAKGPPSLALALGMMIGGGQGFDPSAGAQFVEMLTATEAQVRR